MSLGTIKAVRRTGVSHSAKLAVRDFALWVLRRAKSAYLDGSDVEVVIYLGADLRHTYYATDDRDDFEKIEIPLHGMARSIWQRNYARMKAGKPMRMTLHITPQVLCHPIEITKTIVHEFQHIADMVVNTITRAGKAHRPLPHGWMERRAEAAEAAFMLVVPRHEIIEVFWNTMRDRNVDTRELHRFCHRYTASTP